MSRLSAAVLALIMLSAACTGQPSEDALHLSVTGSSTVAPLMAAIGERYEAAHAHARIDVQTGGSGRGIADVRNGKAPVGMVSRGLHDDEADLRAHTIALDGLGIILHRDNPLRELSSAQVAAIYAGTISDWSEIGGSPGRIVVVHKAEGRATLELFLEHCQLDNAAVRADVIVGDNAQGIKQVAASPQAIGYVSIGAARVSAELGEAIRLPALDGVAADLANVRSGRWPIIRQLNLVTRGPPDPFAAELIAYARSSAVADLCTELAFVPPR